MTKPPNSPTIIDEYKDMADYFRNEFAEMHINLARLAAGEPPKKDAFLLIWYLYDQLEELKRLKSQQLG